MCEREPDHEDWDQRDDHRKSEDGEQYGIEEVCLALFRSKVLFFARGGGERSDDKSIDRSDAIVVQRWRQR